MHSNYLSFQGLFSLQTYSRHTQLLLGSLPTLPLNYQGMSTILEQDQEPGKVSSLIKLDTLKSMHFWGSCMVVAFLMPKVNCHYIDQETVLSIFGRK